MNYICSMAKFSILLLLLVLGYQLSAQTPFDKNNDVRQLELKYGIDLVTDSFAGGTYSQKWAVWSTPTEADSTVFDQFISIFADEWNDYPTTWISVNNLKKIVFVKNLRVTDQYRFAMPDPYDEVLFYDIEYLQYGEEYLRLMTHHEFWHSIEEQHFGTMYLKNLSWSKFNLKNFQYIGSGSDAFTDGKYTEGEHTKKGFTTNYAMYGEEEDRAELYCWLFTKRTWKLINKWSKCDRRLKGKLNWMLSFIEDKVPEMNKAFFDEVNE